MRDGCVGVGQGWRGAGRGVGRQVLVLMLRVPRPRRACPRHSRQLGTAAVRT